MILSGIHHSDEKEWEERRGEERRRGRERERERERNKEMEPIVLRLR
jgi:hypothetical protein